MTVMSIAICNKNAKIILARQFEKMTRMELEEHIVNFSRNVDTCKDTTHFETERVRYLFVSLDNLYLILITQKQSNIIEDIEIIKTVYRLLQDICLNITEDTIKQNSVAIVLSLDDVISLGLREGVNLGQIKTFLQMESQDEKEFKKEQDIIVQKQKKELDLRGKELDKQRRAQQREMAITNQENSFSERKSETISIGSNNITEIEETNTTPNKSSQNKKKGNKGMQLTKKKKHEEDDDIEN